MEKPLRGKVQKKDFPTSLGNPHTPRGFPLSAQPQLLLGYERFFINEDDRKTHNSTSPEINLLQRKNGLDFGVHFNPGPGSAALPRQRPRPAGTALCPAVRYVKALKRTPTSS